MCPSCRGSKTAQLDNRGTFVHKVCLECNFEFSVHRGVTVEDAYNNYLEQLKQDKQH